MIGNPCQQPPGRALIDRDAAVLVQHPGRVAAQDSVTWCPGCLKVAQTVPVKA
jgi:hypothetical protein